MRGILNAGYSRETAYVVRVANEIKGDEPGTESEYDPAVTTPATGLARFSCWCPKVMAAIGRLPETLADRCIVIRMQRKSAQEECARLQDLDETEIRRKCARFVNDHEREIGEARPEGAKGLNDRAGDIWEPLLVLADLAGGDWPRLAREAAQGLSGGLAESNVIGLLLIHILVVFKRRSVERIFSRDLVSELNAFENRPWAEGLKGERIDEYWLANQLRRYGVRPKTTWINRVIAKGYLREDFEEVFGRYITKADVEEATGERESESSKHQSPSTREAPIANDQSRSTGKEETESSKLKVPGSKEAVSNHGTATAAGAQVPSNAPREERAGPQTKARKEDWRRIAGI